ncbi:RHS domain-containing protein [Delftia sp. S67]|nr:MULTISPECIES: RHS domain-containing protein [unclassified Delftia]MBK0111257.1 RHS domain-containing protein [Delftia sp. S65]MBK0116973.1 RHS domain-containing protein [Delftia sp. S67]MBK0128432.1 RHS domain-containing protein [Delftia sp. S66]
MRLIICSKTTNCRNRKRTARPHRLHHYHCDHLGAPIALTDPRQARWPGLPSWTPGAMCCRNTTRKASTRRSGTMTGRRGCIATGIGITIRWWGLY